jgi:hypothetical protein
MECDGNCYKKNDTAELQKVLSQMLIRRNFKDFSNQELKEAAGAVINGRCESIPMPNEERLSVCAGMGWRK